MAHPIPIRRRSQQIFSINSTGVRMIDRRSFMRVSGGTAASFLFADILRADPYARVENKPPPSHPIRVRGIVQVNGRGVPGVRLTDGLQVISTDRDGSYEMITSSDREYLTVSTPSGYRIPINETGTAAGYVPIPSDSRDEMSASFALDRLEASDDEHVALMLPDIQTEDRQEMAWFHERSVPDLIGTVRQYGDLPILGISCGDIMYDDLSLYPEYERGVQRIGVPFFQVVGNHDLDQAHGTDEESTTTFAQHFGPRYRSFDRGAVHYVILDDVFWHGAGYIGYLDKQQLTWLENDLRFVEPGRPVVVATHIPVLGTGHSRRGQNRPGLTVSIANRELLYQLLEPYEAHVVCGHTHENDHNTQGGVHEHVSGTVCGAWWSGPICADGTPNGYAVYEVQGEEISWRYKATGFDAAHQMRTYARGSDPDSPDEIIANVWDWDEGWSVVWYEDGERKGQMARRIGLDPLSVQLHAGEDLPPRRKWVDPYPTQHLFYAPASRNAKEIRVEATDAFGRTYVSTVPTS